jgi:hypothetical protein
MPKKYILKLKSEERKQLRAPFRRSCGARERNTTWNSTGFLYSSRAIALTKSNPANCSLFSHHATRKIF